MHRPQLIVILIFAIFTLQLQAQSKWRLPDSPTGKMSSALLDAIEHEDDEFRREFIQTMFTESFLEAFSLEVHLNAFNETHQLLGDFELVGVNKRAPLQAELVLQSKESDRRIRIIYHLEDQEPYRISLMGIEPVASTPRFSDLKSLENFLDEQSAADNFSGVVLIAKGEHPIFKRVYGLASKRYQVPNRVDTKFNMGSINKIFSKWPSINFMKNKNLDLMIRSVVTSQEFQMSWPTK